MANPALFDKLIAKLRTTDEVSRTIHCLEQFSGSFYAKKTTEEKQQIFRKLPKELAEILIAELASVPVTTENQITIKRQVDELLDKLRRCKSMKLTIAFEPDDPTISLFSDWVKRNVSPDLLIDLQFDKSIVGGAMLIAGGVYKDYTVKKKLANRFQIQREEIIKLLN